MAAVSQSRVEMSHLAIRDSERSLVRRDVVVLIGGIDVGLLAGTEGFAIPDTLVSVAESVEPESLMQINENWR